MSFGHRPAGGSEVGSLWLIPCEIFFPMFVSFFSYFGVNEPLFVVVVVVAAVVVVVV